MTVVKFFPMKFMSLNIKHLHQINPGVYSI